MEPNPLVCLSPSFANRRPPTGWPPGSTLWAALCELCDPVFRSNPVFLTLVFLLFNVSGSASKQRIRYDAECGDRAGIAHAIECAVGFLERRLRRLEKGIVIDQFSE